MTRIMLSLIVGSALALALAAAPADADQARSFVSQVPGFGSDAHAPDCTRAAPCAHFQVAHDHTLDNGEITVLDPGSYGSVTITKNISIINDGVGEAGILVSGGGTGITVNAPGTAAVTLRGITIKGIGFGGGDAIHFNAGGALNVENCTIRNLDGAGVGNGILFQPSTTSHLAVSDTAVTDNAGAAIAIMPTGGLGVRAELKHVQALRNGLQGVLAFGTNLMSGTIRVTMVESESAFNNTGVTVQSNASPTTLEVINSILSHNAGALVTTDPFATLLFGGATVTGNARTRIITNSATLLSFGDNYIFDNDDGNPTPPTTPKK